MTTDPLAWQYEPITVEDSGPNGEVGFSSRYLELPGCTAQGLTRAASVQNLEVARRTYIRALIASHVPVPPPVVELERCSTISTVTTTTHTTVIKSWMPPPAFPRQFATA